MSNIYEEKISPIKIQKGKGTINRYMLYTSEGEEVQFSYIVDAQEALAVVDDDGNHKYFIEKPKKVKSDDKVKNAEVQKNIGSTENDKK